MNIWKEGKYIDLWLIPHLLIGILLGQLFLLINFNLTISLIIILALAIIWELFEIIIKIKEAIPNKIIDVLAAIVGFYIIKYLYLSFDIFKNWISFFILLIIYSVITIHGLVSRKK